MKEVRYRKYTKETRAKVYTRAMELKNANLPWHEVVARMNAEGYRTPQNEPLTSQFFMINRRTVESFAKAATANTTAIAATDLVRNDRLKAQKKALIESVMNMELDNATKIGVCCTRSR